MFGGFGYMMGISDRARSTRTPVCSRIYGGTNEIMKELASRFM
jgi:hypothetical protein